MGELGGRPGPAHPGGRVNIGEVAETLGLTGIDRATGGIEVDEEEAEAIALLAHKSDLRAIGRPGRAAILAAVGQALAAGGAQVQFVTASYSPVSARNTDNWEERYIVGRMKANGVRLRPSTWLRVIEPGAVVLYDVHTGQESREAADAVILSTAREPADGLARALEGKVAQLYTIGDALAARMLAAATYEGQKFARLIGEPGAPATVSEVWFAPDDPATAMLPADAPRLA